MLALDTATAAVTAGIVRLSVTDAPDTMAARVTVNARAHGELLTPHVTAVLADAGLGFADVDAIVCGTGPGPFTGLRVGMVTAAALGHAIGRPVYGVCSLDAIAADLLGTSNAPFDSFAGQEGAFVVVTDARRREVYWAAYANGARVAGPAVHQPSALVAELAELDVRAIVGPGAELVAEALQLPIIAGASPGPSPAGLVAVTAADVRAGIVPEPLRPLYLRRPDATEPGARKRVLAPVTQPLRSS